MKIRIVISFLLCGLIPIQPEVKIFLLFWLIAGVVNRIKSLHLSYTDNYVRKEVLRQHSAVVTLYLRYELILVVETKELILRPYQEELVGPGLNGNNCIILAPTGVDIE